VLANPWLYDSRVRSVAALYRLGSLYLWRVRKIFSVSANSTSAKNLMEHPYPGNGPEVSLPFETPRWTKLTVLTVRRHFEAPG